MPGGRRAVGLAEAPGRPSHAAPTDRESEALRDIVAGGHLTKSGETPDRSDQGGQSAQACILDELGVGVTAKPVPYGLQHHVLDDLGARP